MRTSPIQLADVIYNAANQCFEGLVTVHDKYGSARYACAINAPITMSFEDAAKGLATQARRRHAAKGSLRSKRLYQAPRSRAGRMGRDPVKWLAELISGTDKKAA